jgi:predicted permease
MRSSLFQGLRLTRTRPAFAAAVVGTLAIAIGAIAAVFGVIDRLLVRPLPFPDPEQIVFIENSWPMFVDSDNGEPVSAPDAFTHLAQYEAGRVTIGGTEPRVIRAARVTRDFFALLGLAPAVGHFPTGTDAPADAGAVVISDALAHSAFGGPAAALGKLAMINGSGYAVTAVLPPAFPFTVRGQAVDVWLPFSDDAALFRTIQVEGTGAVARLRSTLSLRDAQARSETFFRRLADQRPQWRLDESDRMRLIPLREYWFGSLRTPLLMLFGAGCCLLAIACANTAGLMLARGSARRRDTAIRTALGASRSQLVRESLGESMVLGLLAAAVGLLFAHWGVKLMLAVSPTHIPHADDIGLSARVAAFTIVAGLVTACAASLMATWRAARGDLSRGLNAGAHDGTFMGVRVRQALVIVQVAITVLLLLNTGLLLRSFRALRYESTGFDARDVLALEIAPEAARFPDPASRLPYFSHIIDGVRSVPGLDAVAMVSHLPVESGSFIIPVSTRERAGTGEFAWSYRAATADYFQAMRIPLLAGRSFTEADRPNTPRVVILDQSAAAMLAGGSDRTADVIGRHIVIDSGDQAPLEIIGIVGDIRQQGLGIPTYPGFYVSAIQRPPAVVNLVVRTSSDPALFADAVRAALRTADPALPVGALHAMESRISDTVSRRRFAVVLSGVLGSAALLMSIAGLSALMSQFVVHRTHEIGVRVAIGARPIHVLRLVMQQAGGMAAIGVAAGVAAALATTPLVAGLLYGVSASDPVTFLTVPLLVVITAALACSAPALRALRANPVDVLRGGG